MSRLPAGSLVVVDWRGGALPREPTKIRPAIVVEHEALFEDNEPNLIVVPLTRDERLLTPAFAIPIEPTPENGALGLSWALPHYVTSISQQRARHTASRVTDGQLWDIRQRIALAIGLL